MAFDGFRLEYKESGQEQTAPICVQSLEAAQRAARDASLAPGDHAPNGRLVYLTAFDAKTSTQGEWIYFAGQLIDEDIEPAPDVSA